MANSIKIFDELKNKPLPDFPEPKNEYFDDWIISLIEMDAYIVRIVSSRLGGDKEEDPDLNYKFMKIKRGLEAVELLFDSDRATYTSCVDYLHAL